jgi:hypothetical protein
MPCILCALEAGRTEEGGGGRRHASAQAPGDRGRHPGPRPGRGARGRSTPGTPKARRHAATKPGKPSNPTQNPAPDQAPGRRPGGARTKRPEDGARGRAPGRGGGNTPPRERAAAQGNAPGDQKHHPPSPADNRGGGGRSTPGNRSAPPSAKPRPPRPGHPAHGNGPRPGEDPPPGAAPTNPRATAAGGGGRGRHERAHGTAKHPNTKTAPDSEPSNSTRNPQSPRTRVILCERARIPQLSQCAVPPASSSFNIMHHKDGPAFQAT